MRISFRLFLTTVCALWLSVVTGQNTVPDIPITAAYNDQTVQEVLADLEQRTPFKFYFQASDLPEERQSFTFAQTPLQQVLVQLLATKDLSFLNYRDYAIFIVPKDFIASSFSSDFYVALENSIRGADALAEGQPDLTVGQVESLESNGKAIVRGQVVDGTTEEPIIGATVFWKNLNQGTATDVDGNFEIEIESGRHELMIQYVGFDDYNRSVAVMGSGTLNVQLDKAAIELKEVLVRAEAANVNIESAQVGVARLDVKSIKKLPSFLGEIDVIKSLLLQPGISTIGEGAIGFNVRGGEVDQNLLMQDEGLLFNASHALGFFSTLNPELISYVTLYKGNIPAQFGGRLASVLDVEMRDGSFQNYKAQGGLGLVASKVNLEGPIVKGKSSLILGFRSSYSDWVLRLIRLPEVKQSSASFYDLNLRYTDKINDRNTITFSLYSTRDDFAFNNQFGYEYGTQMGQFTYKKIFSDRLFSRLSVTASRYESTQLDLDGTDAQELDNNVTYYKIKELLTYSPDNDLELNAGVSSILYQVDPGDLRPRGELSQVKARSVEREQGLESALFLNANWNISPAFAVSGGLRFGMYNALGPGTFYEYEDPENPRLVNLKDSSFFSGAKVVATYTSLEPRVSFRYRLSPQASVKGGYSRTAQFINLIANTNTPTPSSQWQLSNKNIRPLRSHNFSVGYFLNSRNNNWEFSTETYLRYIDDLFDYRDFAELTANEFLETQLLTGIGRAYGLELSAKKKQGRWDGYLSYTLSRTEKQVEGINQKNWFPSNFDKPHDVSLVFNFHVNRRNTLSFNFIYGTGRPTTAPIGSYVESNGLVIPIYSDRNQLRVPDYHRLDLAYTLGKGYNLTRKIKTSWTISLYNLYSRQNAFSVFFTQRPFQAPVANKLAILGNIFPALTFNFETL